MENRKEMEIRDYDTLAEIFEDTEFLTNSTESSLEIETINETTGGMVVVILKFSEDGELKEFYVENV